ncbi:predicted protein [Nematostella vectensis]|uniref:Uncharacterized protein n=1 Tax=Nematostella vectensis TaxID=45351 RepID=A7SVG1_NEMVE|nr:predicted protein [Nematostella vectensis]|eukprot:XP_001624403.1 predicted protein [Nematostella vectensis]
MSHSEAPEHSEEIEADGTRRTKKTHSGLCYSVELKRNEIGKSLKRLLKLVEKAENANEEDWGKMDIGAFLGELTTAHDEFTGLFGRLGGLYEQDKFGEFGEESKMVPERAYSNESRHSRTSRHSSVKSTASRARVKALAEAKAAREEAHYERLIAKKYLERNEREAEEEINRAKERARHETEIAILEADKKAAIASAKLKAIKQALCEEEYGVKFNLPECPKSGGRTQDWVSKITPVDQGSLQRATEPGNVPKETVSQHRTQTASHAAVKQEFGDNPKRSADNPFVKSETATMTPTINTHLATSGNDLLNYSANLNQQILAGLARQNLPKCQPDKFSGDATLFHPWKSAFLAMLEDASVSATQQINYMRSFTSGEPQRLVDSYRKRQHRDPSTLLNY